MKTRAERIGELMAKKDLSREERWVLKNLLKRERDLYKRIRKHKSKAPVLKVRGR